jgi:hypothetical protein
MERDGVKESSYHNDCLFILIRVWRYFPEQARICVVDMVIQALKGNKEKGKGKGNKGEKRKKKGQIGA